MRQTIAPGEFFSIRDPKIIANIIELYAQITADSKALIFKSIALRDAFWATNKDLLVINESHSFTVIGGVLTLQNWQGVSSPTIYDGANWQLAGHKVKKESGLLKLITPEPIALDLIGQWYRITGVYSDNGTNYNFITSADGVLTYIGKGDKFMPQGVSDAISSKVAEITYVIFRNGELSPGTESPHGFPTANSSETLAITDIINVETGDTFEVYAKSDAINTSLMPNTLTVTFLG